MNELSTRELAVACRIFMDLAYPEGVRTIPEFKLPFFEMTAEHSLIEFLPPAPRSVGVSKTLSRNAGGMFGYEFRLGSATYPHLKLRVQSMDLHQHATCGFTQSIRTTPSAPRRNISARKTPRSGKRSSSKIAPSSMPSSKHSPSPDISRRPRFCASISRPHPDQSGLLRITLRGTIVWRSEPPERPVEAPGNRLRVSSARWQSSSMEWIPCCRSCRL